LQLLWSEEEQSKRTARLSKDYHQNVGGSKYSYSHLLTLLFSIRIIAH